MDESRATVEHGDHERRERDVVVEIAGVLTLQVDRRNGGKPAGFGKIVQLAAAALAVRRSVEHRHEVGARSIEEPSRIERADGELRVLEVDNRIVLLPALVVARNCSCVAGKSGGDEQEGHDRGPNRQEENVRIGASAPSRIDVVGDREDLAARVVDVDGRADLCAEDSRLAAGLPPARVRPSGLRRAVHRVVFRPPPRGGSGGGVSRWRDQRIVQRQVEVNLLPSQEPSFFDVQLVLHVIMPAVRRRNRIHRDVRLGVVGVEAHLRKSHTLEQDFVSVPVREVLAVVLAVHDDRRRRGCWLRGQCPDDWIVLAVVAETANRRDVEAPAFDRAFGGGGDGAAARSLVVARDVELVLAEARQVVLGEQIALVCIAVDDPPPVRIDGQVALRMLKRSSFAALETDDPESSAAWTSLTLPSGRTQTMLTRTIFDLSASPAWHSPAKLLCPRVLELCAKTALIWSVMSVAALAAASA